MKSHFVVTGRDGANALSRYFFVREKERVGRERCTYPLKEERCTGTVVRVR